MCICFTGHFNNHTNNSYGLVCEGVNFSVFQLHCEKTLNSVPFLRNQLKMILATTFSITLRQREIQTLYKKKLAVKRVQVFE